MALSVSDLVSVSVNVSSTGAANRGFGTLLIIGDSTVISTTERMRTYISIAGVLADFGNTSPEYLAAQAYFAQIPTPPVVMIGRQGSGETAIQALTACVTASSAWYAVIFTTATAPTDLIYSGTLCPFVEALVPSRILGITTSDANTLLLSDTTSLAHTLQALNLSKTVMQYSSSNPYAIAAFFGRALTVDFTANKTTITMMYKQEVLVTAENLTESQAVQLKAKKVNVFVNYDNATATAVVQFGTVIGGRFFDEVQGLDWLQNALQVGVYNLLYQSRTKVPQTNSGGGQIIGAINSVLDQSVDNGLVAAGTWNSGGFGALNRGDFLKYGYYTYVAPIETQSQADRELRICPPIQIAVKLAGAIHSIAITVNVNR